MVQKVIDGVCRVLHEKMPEAMVADEPIWQGMQTPCFTVTSDGLTTRRVLGKRFYCSVSVCVTFFGGDGHRKEKEYHQYELLADWLELLPTEEGYVRGSNIHTEQRNGHMCFLVTYGYYALAQETADMMQTLDDRQHIK